MTTSWKGGHLLLCVSLMDVDNLALLCHSVPLLDPAEEVCALKLSLYC